MAPSRFRRGSWGDALTIVSKSQNSCFQKLGTYHYLLNLLNKAPRGNQQFLSEGQNLTELMGGGLATPLWSIHCAVDTSGSVEIFFKPTAMTFWLQAIRSIACSTNGVTSDFCALMMFGFCIIFQWYVPSTPTLFFEFKTPPADCDPWVSRKKRQGCHTCKSWGHFFEHYSGMPILTFLCL